MSKYTNNNDRKPNSQPENPKFPILIFPEPFKALIKEASKSLGFPEEFMAGGMLFVVSVLVGNTYRIRIKPGWEEPAMLWLVQVGKPATMKTPPSKMVLKPLYGIDAGNYKVYQSALDTFENLTDKQKRGQKEPGILKYIFNDFTIEALFRRHNQNQRGIGVYRNELAGWFGNMNQYKKNSNEQSAWINIWDGDKTDIDRVTRGLHVINRPHIPVLGGIQPAILQKYLSDPDNAYSGLVDRLLYLLSDKPVKSLDDLQITDDVSEAYEDKVVRMERNLREVFQGNSNETSYISYCKEAWGRIKSFDKRITEVCKTDIPESMQAYYKKLRTYLHRLALVIEIMHADGHPKEISLNSAKYAIEAIKYFQHSYYLVKNITSSWKEIEAILKTMQSKTKKEKASILIKKGISVQEIASALETTEAYIRNIKSRLRS